ncbi:MAG: hypothetical protein KGL35_24390 [Bradyrhizobium sp.]|nr:hypothetical protein [Bradyrhizobium sp.]
MARFLTATDAIIMLSVPPLFTTPQQLQGFSTNNVYDVGVRQGIETMMGVDGILSGGVVKNPVEQTFTLQADSLSNDFFEAWDNAQQQGNTVYTASGTTTLPGLGKSYVMTKGFLVSLPPLPNAAKILDPRKFMIRWQSVVGNPI